MRISGRPTIQTSFPTDPSPEVQGDAANHPHPPTAEALQSPPAAGGPSRDSVQAAVLASAELAKAGGVEALGAADAASGTGAVDGKNAALRAAFDKISAPGAVADTYRLDRNVDAYASRWRTMEGATKTLDTTYFIFEKDLFGYATLGNMLKKAKDGVKVRTMLDGNGDPTGKLSFHTLGVGDDYLQELVNANPDGVEVKIYNPIYKKDFSSLATFMASNHDKLMIADGDTVETGGRNVSADYFSDPKDKPGVYRDTDINVRSTTTAKSATEAFEAEFLNDDVTVEVKPDLFGNTVKRDIELLGAYRMMDTWLKAPPLSEAEKTEIRSTDAAPQRFVDAVLRDVRAGLKEEGIDREPDEREMKLLTELATQLVNNPELRGTYDNKPESFTNEIKVVDNVSAAGEGAREISPTLLSLIGTAQKSIFIHNPYVVLTDTALDALAEASARGVEIIIGTNSPESTDSNLTQAFFLEDWPKILARVPNARMMVATGTEKQHSKTFVVDDVLTGISTYNADWISARVNSEVVTLAWGEEFAQDTTASYQASLDDPGNGVVEYKILRDKEGRALLVDGEPVVEFGPEDHMPKEQLDETFGMLTKVTQFARNNLPGLKPIRSQDLDANRDAVREMDWANNPKELRYLAESSAGRRALEGVMENLESGWTTDDEAAQIQRVRQTVTAFATIQERVYTIESLFDGITSGGEEQQIRTVLTQANAGQLSGILDKVSLERLASELEDDDLGAVMASLAKGAGVGNNADHLLDLLKRAGDDPTRELMGSVSDADLAGLGKLTTGRKAIGQAIENLDAGWTNGSEGDMIDRLKRSR